ncbi:MAG: hypothetical protein IJG45_07805 [Oscillospiraceae bacterium]|nr:hypothetical protein [Oscillospiraceae bacterium]
MDHPVLRSLLQQPLLLIFMGAFAVLMALMIPAYFFAYRPKVNSTEWIGRLDRRSFKPLTASALTPADIIWTLIAMLCAAFLWIAYFIRRVASILLLLKMAIPIAVTALSVFLILRLMGGKPLPAILAAVIGGVSLFGQARGIAAFTLSLLFLYLWVCVPYDAPLFFHALWLAFSAAAYGVALLFHFPLIWAAPFYAGAYVTVQVLRFRHGTPGARGKKLAASIVLLLLLLAFGTIAVWLVYCVRHQKASPIDLLRSFSFYRRLFPALISRFSTLMRRPSYWRTLVFSDSFCFIAGVMAMVPLLHGLIKQRDTRCLFLLLLLPCLLLAWYFSACYALIPVFALIIGWCWCQYAQRGRPLYAVGFAATYILFLFAEMLIH